MAGLEYSKNGLVGVLTPQANTTVEPEFRVLWPKNVGMINARMISNKNTIADRLLDYVDQIESTLNRFANAPVDAVAFGCTGASYLIGREKEKEICNNIKDKRGYPFVTAARAVTDTFEVLSAKKIGLVSPYPGDLTEQSAGYWKSAGYEVAEVASSYNQESDFHPIYSLSAENAFECIQLLENRNLDAIVMLGTGMPTLSPLVRLSNWSGPPVTSCMLSLAWRTVMHVSDTQPNADNLKDWLSGNEWRDRMNLLYDI